MNLGAYYLVGLPCAIIFTFVFHFGGKVLDTKILATLTAYYFVFAFPLIIQGVISQYQDASIFVVPFIFSTSKFENKTSR